MSKPRWLMVGLLTVNAVLAGGLLLRGTADTPAFGQAVARPHSGEMLVAGSAANNQSLLYVLDTATGRLAVFQPDTLRRTTQVIATADVTQDMDRAVRR